MSIGHSCSRVILAVSFAAQCAWGADRGLRIEPAAVENTGPAAFTVFGSGFGGVTGAELGRDPVALAPLFFASGGDAIIQLGFDLNGQSTGTWTLRLLGPAPQEGTIEVLPGRPVVASVHPPEALNTGVAAFTVKGARFDQVIGAELRLLGETLAPAHFEIVDGETISVSFDLSGRPAALWTLRLLARVPAEAFITVSAPPLPGVALVSPSSALNVGVSTFSVLGRHLDLVTGAELELAPHPALAPVFFQTVDSQHLTVAFNLDGRPVGAWTLRLKAAAPAEALVGVFAPPAPHIRALSPDAGINIGPVVLRAFGTNFTHVRAAELARDGGVLRAAALEVSNDAELTARFDLAGLSTGPWTFALSGLGGRAEAPFAVYPAPRVSELSPSATVNRGGLYLTVKGEGFQTVTGAQLVLGDRVLQPVYPVYPLDGGTRLLAQFDLDGQPAGAWTLRLLGQVETDVSLPVVDVPPSFQLNLYQPSGLIPGRPSAYYLYLRNVGSEGVALASVDLPEGVEFVAASREPFFRDAESNTLLFAVPLAANTEEWLGITVRLDPDKVLFPGQAPAPGKVVGMEDSLHAMTALQAALTPAEWEAVSERGDTDAIFRAAEEKSFENFFQFHLGLVPLGKAQRIDLFREVQAKVSDGLAQSLAGFHIADRAVHLLQGGDPSDPPQDSEGLAEFLKRKTPGERPYLRQQKQAYGHIFEELAKRGRAVVHPDGNHYTLLDSDGKSHMEFFIDKEVTDGAGGSIKSPRTGKKLFPDKTIVDHKKKQVYVTDPVACPSCEHSRKNLDYGDGLKKKYPDYNVKPPMEFDTQKRKLFDSTDNVQRLSKTPGVPGQKCLLPDVPKANSLVKKGLKRGAKEIPILDIIAAVAVISQDPSLDTVVEEVGGLLPGPLGAAWSEGYSLGKELRTVEVMDGVTLGRLSELAGEHIGSRGLDKYVLEDLPAFYTGLVSRLWDEGPGAAACAPKGSSVVAARDPNALYALPPAGPVKAGDKLRFRVEFENVPDATAAAQDVTVTLDLDPDVSPAQAVLDGASHPGRVVSEITPAGRIRWHFQGIDLPPNKNPPEGEGWAEFTVKLDGGLPSGTLLDHRASIVFDFNPPIETNALRHAVDRFPPRTRVEPRVQFLGSSRYRLAWTGRDDQDGSGLAQVRLYAAGDGDAYALQRAAGGSGATEGNWEFDGLPGRTYSFMSVGLDNAGHEEPVPDVPDLVVDPDRTAPTLSCPVEIKARCGRRGRHDCGRRCRAYVSLKAAASDDRDLVVDVSHRRAGRQTAGGDASGYYPHGLTRVVFSATDDAGNRSECVTRVKVGGKKKRR